MDTQKDKATPRKLNNVFTPKQFEGIEKKYSIWATNIDDGRCMEVLSVHKSFELAQKAQQKLADCYSVYYTAIRHNGILIERYSELSNANYILGV